MKVGGTWRRTIEPAPDGASVAVLDQARLPYEVAWLRLGALDAVARAIRDMHVRGAPLIGVTAAYGVAIALRADPAALDAACALLGATRPTAINLAWALDRMRRVVGPVAAGERAAAAWREASAIADEDVAQCAAIGDHGVALIEAARRGGGPVRVLTHCNAGWLATVDWGTALAPIYKAHERGIPVHVWVDETRPRNQGLLTAWELAQHGVPHTVIADNAGGHLMQRGEVDLCLVGTDRTTRNGDVCNKIGTYLKALAARDCGVPFYAAVPSSSIDWTVGEPAEIPIEERAGDEVRFVAGLDGDRPIRVATVPPASAVANPAFDVTPHRLVTGLVTERGVAAASLDGLRALFPAHPGSGA
jgi:methylthioribose-1-phosphate isomerase